jgi:hypothetical protein
MTGCRLEFVPPLAWSNFILLLSSVIPFKWSAKTAVELGVSITSLETPRSSHNYTHASRCPLSRKQGGCQISSWCFKGKINPLPLPGIESGFVEFPARSFIIVPTTLSRVLASQDGHSLCGTSFYVLFCKPCHFLFIPHFWAMFILAF